MIQFDERASFSDGVETQPPTTFFWGGFRPEDRVNCTHGGAGWEKNFTQKNTPRLRLPEAPGPHDVGHGPAFWVESS